MPVTPLVTLTGTLQDLTGTANPGSVTVRLANFGNLVPTITGTSVLAQVINTAIANGSGVFSITLWGNDVISPPGTYYEVVYLNSVNGEAKVVPYQFNGSGTFDISSIDPLISIPGEPAAQLSFGSLNSGTNSHAAMVVTTGSSISFSGSGIINASKINGVPITGDISTAVGKIPISQGDGSAVWADPLVQGLQAAGTSASTVNPVLIGFKGADGNIHTASSDNTGALNITGSITASNPSVSTTGTAIPASGTLSAGSDGTNLRALKVSSTGVLSVDGSASTQPVSGTVTANIGTSGSLALDATLTGGTQKTKLVDTAGTNVATISAGGALKVDGSAATQPVSGTVTANAGTGTFAISASSLPLPSGASTAAKQPALGTAGTASADVISIQGIASMTAVKVDGSAVTQPVSAASLPLPSGASTAAKQPALGTAGTASADVITVQGIASMTALKVDGSGVTQPISGTVAATQSGTWTVQPGNTANTTAWKVDGSAVTQPVSGTVTTTPPANASSNIAQINGVTPLMGNGVTGTGSQRVTIASDNTAFSVNATLSAETTKVIGTINVAAAQSIAATQSGTWTVQPGNTANTTAWKVDGSAVTQPVSGTVTANAGTGTFTTSSVPTTTGGLSFASGSIGATKTAIKASAGQIYGYHIGNANASAVYVQIFNVASASVTLGTTAPDMSLFIPAGGGAVFSTDVGIAFGTAITIAITTTRTGSTGPGSTVDYNIMYK